MVSLWFPSAEFVFVVSGIAILGNKNGEKIRKGGGRLQFFDQECETLFPICDVIIRYFGAFGTSRSKLVQSFCCSVSQNGQQLFYVFYAIYKRHTINTEPAKNLVSFFFAAGAAVGS